MINKDVGLMGVVVCAGVVTAGVVVVTLELRNFV